MGSQHTDEKGGRGEGRRKEIRACQGGSRYCCESKSRKRGWRDGGKAKQGAFRGADEAKQNKSCTGGLVVAHPPGRCWGSGGVGCSSGVAQRGVGAFNSS